MQLDGGQFPQDSQEYGRWKEWRDKVAVELRQSVRRCVQQLPKMYQSKYIFFQFNNLKASTSSITSHHLDLIKQLQEVQSRILDHELNKWKREQQLSGNGAPFANNLDQIQKW